MIRLTLAAALALLAPALASAETVKPGAAHTVRIKDDVTAVVHYAERADAFEVVSTVASGAGPALRVTTRLMDGETAVVEAAGPVGAARNGIVLSRTGDALDVRPIKGDKTAALD